MTVRARFDGKAFVPIDPVDLPADRIVELEIREAEALPRGSPALLRKMMHEGPHLEPGDIEALEAAIEAGKIPVRYSNPFDDQK